MYEWLRQDDRAPFCRELNQRNPVVPLDEVVQQDVMRRVVACRKLNSCLLRRLAVSRSAPKLAFAWQMQKVADINDISMVVLVAWWNTQRFKHTRTCQRQVYGVSRNSSMNGGGGFFNIVKLQVTNGMLQFAGGIRNCFINICSYNLLTHKKFPFLSHLSTHHHGSVISRYSILLRYALSAQYFCYQCCGRQCLLQHV